MPIYEYRCNRCQQLETVFLRSFSETAHPVCSRCGGTDLRKLMSRFYSPRAEDERLDAMADPSAFGDVDESDPRSIARWAKRLAAETGEDMGDDFREMVDMMAAGQMPDDDEAGFGEADDPFGAEQGGSGLPAELPPDAETLAEPGESGAA